MINIIDDDYSIYSKNGTITNRIHNVITEVNGDDNLSWLTSNDAKLIIINEEDAGYIYTTFEHWARTGLFIDMGIIEKYRNNGHGYNTLRRFVLGRIGMPLYSRVKPDNDFANRLCNEIGERILTNEYNYYIFPKSTRIQEIISTDKVKVFK